MSNVGFFNVKHPVMACQWFKNGDYPEDGVGEPRLDDVALLNAHPELLDQHGWVGTITPEMRQQFSYPAIEGKVVRFFRRPEPEYAGTTRHSCSFTWNEHGWIDDGSHGDDGVTVCPGSWIVVDRHYRITALNQSDFFDEYERLRRD